MDLLFAEGIGLYRKTQLEDVVDRLGAALVSERDEQIFEKGLRLTLSIIHFKEVW